jgi:GTP-binding protein LepA
MRKNVLAKCCGGDISRKRFRARETEEGKKRMKQVGEVQIPRSVSRRAEMGTEPE